MKAMKARSNSSQTITETLSMRNQAALSLVLLKDFVRKWFRLTCVW